MIEIVVAHVLNIRFDIAHVSISNPARCFIVKSNLHISKPRVFHDHITSVGVFQSIRAPPDVWQWIRIGWLVISRSVQFQFRTIQYKQTYQDVTHKPIVACFDHARCWEIVSGFESSYSPKAGNCGGFKSFRTYPSPL